MRHFQNYVHAKVHIDGNGDMYDEKWNLINTKYIYYDERHNTYVHVVQKGNVVVGLVIDGFF